MKKIIATIVCTMCTAAICAQLVWLAVDKQPFAGTYSRNFQQLLTALQNQAALSYVPVVTAGAGTERRFMLKEISTHTLAVALPVRHGGFGLHLQQSGYTDYRRQTIGLAYGRTLGDRFSIGMQVNYLSRIIPQYTSAHALVFELSCLMHLTPQLHIGMQAFNPAGSELQRLDNEKVPSIYRAGLGYEVTPTFLLSAAVTQETGTSTATKIMCEYRIIKQLSLQLGICTDPQLSNAAIGITLRQLYILLSSSYHPQLGITPATAIVWQLKQQH
ncbi:hypothetical protein [Chitinophaga sp. S165]|uniref:hypothetical protein n=1 Tax=Chitinophaga sp. S165 TaxID=2135462 RepID=UPI000D94CDDB|nr:hypothetical protein [Chitinophaga sp. S165]PWV47542.1 hypothetical protein C7475_108109 [Chitinophaga sp. S165]